MKYLFFFPKWNSILFTKTMHTTADVVAIRVHLQSLAKKLNITTPQEWSKHSLKSLQEYGNVSLIRGNNLHMLLCQAFPGMYWNHIK